MPIDYHPLLEAKSSALIRELSQTTGSAALVTFLGAAQQALTQETPFQLTRRLLKDRRPIGRLQSLSSSEASTALREIQAVRGLGRITRYYRSRLAPYRQAIRHLKAAGASQKDIQYWLARERDCHVSQSTIHRFLARIEADDKVSPV